MLLESEKRKFLNEGLYKYQVKTVHFYLTYVLKLLSINCAMYEKDCNRYGF